MKSMKTRAQIQTKDEVCVGGIVKCGVVQQYVIVWEESNKARQHPISNPPSFGWYQWEHPPEERGWHLLCETSESRTHWHYTLNW